LIRHIAIEGFAMLKYAAIALLATTAAQAAVPPKKDVQEALKRERLIQELSNPPKSFSNVCRGC
jgi:hypothetical protein